MYVQRCLPKVKALCQDFNWEVRRAMCKNLFKISLYIGSSKSQEQLYNEIIELIDDEESDVHHQSIKTYMKHCLRIYSDDLNRSQQALLAIKRIISFALNPEHSADVKETIYRDINLLLIKVGNSTDQELLKGVQDLVKRTLASDSYKWVGLDILESVTQVHTKASKLIPAFYLQIFQPFFKEYASQADCYA